MKSVLGRFFGLGNILKNLSRGPLCLIFHALALGCYVNFPSSHSSMNLDRTFDIVACDVREIALESSSGDGQGRLFVVVVLQHFVLTHFVQCASGAGAIGILSAHVWLPGAVDRKKNMGASTAIFKPHPAPELPRTRPNDLTPNHLEREMNLQKMSTKDLLVLHN
jgi:hypothetical protein